MAMDVDFTGRHVLDVSAIPPEGIDFAVDMEAEDRALLSELLEVLSVDAVAAKGHVWPLEDGVQVSFHLTGDVTQACVVSLEPVGCRVDEPVSLQYMPQASAPVEAAVIDVTDDEDPPEPLVDGQVDIGVAIAEHLAIGLDPWPRHPDATLPDGSAQSEDSGRPNPFAVLAKLKDEMKN